MKMVPAGKGLARATKIVPDLIKRLGKNAMFSFEGQETPIDCEVAHELTTALVHLIRNAFDHGLESAEQRAYAGKPEQGLVKLSVWSENGLLALEIMDDGKGIDPDELKAMAIAKNVLTVEEAGKLSFKECYGLIFRPGFSTKTEVTEVSGRGVGLDAVAHSVRKKLNGEITMESVIGKGSRFIIRVPAIRTN
jgi:two-component system chemotaxis sensor kinase CheA